MSVFIRLENLCWSASSADVRKFFRGLSIPEGGVHIIGGDKGEAFIAFEKEEDAEIALGKNSFKLKGDRIALMPSNRAELEEAINIINRTDTNSRDRFRSPERKNFHPLDTQQESHQTLRRGHTSDTFVWQKDCELIWDNRKSCKDWNSENLPSLSPRYEEDDHLMHSYKNHKMDPLTVEGQSGIDEYHFRNQEPEVRFVDSKGSIDQNPPFLKRLLHMSGTIEGQETINNDNIYEEYLSPRNDCGDLRSDQAFQQQYFSKDFVDSNKQSIGFESSFSHKPVSGLDYPYDNAGVHDEMKFPYNASNSKFSNIGLAIEENRFRDTMPGNAVLQHSMSLPGTAMLQNENQHSVPNHAIKLCGLPINITHKEVQTILRGFLVPPYNVKFERDDDKKKIGIVYVKMSNYDDFVSVLRLNDLRFNETRIPLEKCPDDIFYTRFSTYAELAGHHRMKKIKVQGYCFLLRGLPYAAIEDDILDFFSDLQLTDLLILYDEDRRATGVGYVQFANEDDYRAAFERNGKKIGYRYIEMTKCSTDDIKNARQSAIALSKPLDEILNSRFYRNRNQVLQQNLPYKRPLCAVLWGLSSTVTTSEIYDFFEECGIQPNAVHNILNEDQNPSGKAFMEFNDLFDFDVALKQQGRNIGQNAISIRQVLFDEMVNILEANHVQYDFNVVRKHLVSTKSHSLPEKLPYIWEPPEETEHTKMKPPNFPQLNVSNNSSSFSVGNKFNGKKPHTYMVKDNFDNRDTPYHNRSKDKTMQYNDKHGFSNRHDVFPERAHYNASKVQVNTQTKEFLFLEGRVLNPRTQPTMYSNVQNKHIKDSQHFQSLESESMHKSSNVWLCGNTQEDSFHNSSKQMENNFFFKQPQFESNQKSKNINKNRNRRRKSAILRSLTSNEIQHQESLKLAEGKVPIMYGVERSKPIGTMGDKLKNAINKTNMLGPKQLLDQSTLRNNVSSTKLKCAFEKGKVSESKVVTSTEAGKGKVLESKVATTAKAGKGKVPESKVGTSAEAGKGKVPESKVATFAEAGKGKVPESKAVTGAKAGKGKVPESKVVTSAEAGKGKVPESKAVTGAPAGKGKVPEIKVVTSAEAGKGKVPESKAVTGAQAGKGKVPESKAVTGAKAGKGKVPENKVATSAEAGKGKVPESKTVTGAQAGKCKVPETKVVTSVEAGKGKVSEVKNVAFVEAVKGDSSGHSKPNEGLKTNIMKDGIDKEKGNSKISSNDVSITKAANASPSCSVVLTAGNIASVANDKVSNTTVTATKKDNQKCDPVSKSKMSNSGETVMKSNVSDAKDKVPDLPSTKNDNNAKCSNERSANTSSNVSGAKAAAALSKASEHVKNIKNISTPIKGNEFNKNITSAKEKDMSCNLSATRTPNSKNPSTPKKAALEKNKIKDFPLTKGGQVKKSITNFKKGYAKNVRRETYKRDIDKRGSNFFVPKQRQYFRESTERNVCGSSGKYISPRDDTYSLHSRRAGKRSPSIDDSEYYYSKKSKYDDSFDVSYRGYTPPIEYKELSPSPCESDSCVVHATYVSPQIGLEEIFDFFREYRLSGDDVIRKYTQCGDITGDVRIAFESASEARRAIKYLDGCYLAGYQISLTLV